MKHIFILACLSTLLLFPKGTKAGEDQRKGAARAWYIKDSVADVNLKKTEAVFDFHFRQPTGAQIKTGIRFSYNGTEKTVTPDEKGHYTLTVEPGTYRFQFYYNSDHEEIETDSIYIKPAYRYQVEIVFASTEIYMPMRKPVIYLYPTTPTEVHLELKTLHPFSFTYPVYNADSTHPGWTVNAFPDGTLEQDGKKFGYLFWEAPSSIQTHPYLRKGFVVNKNELTTFLEEKLAHIGLNSREIQDFVTYWVPEMQQQEKVYLYFMFNDEYNLYANLKVSPQPDQLIRLMMMWEPVLPGADTSDIKTQELPHFERKGFTLVEWGGTQISYMMKCWGW